MLTSRWRGWSLVLMVVGIVGLVGCSSGTGTSPAPTSPAPTSAPVAPEGQPVTAAAVAAGLRKIESTAKEIAEYAGTDKAKAVSLDGEIEPTWRPIEDVVRQNDREIYIAMENSFEKLEKAAKQGDAAVAADGSKAISTAVQDYLAKYSG